MLAYKYKIGYRPSKKNKKVYYYDVVALNNNQANKLVSEMNNTERIKRGLKELKFKAFMKNSKTYRVNDISISIWNWIVLKLFK